jgi:hypothetical protein
MARASSSADVSDSRRVGSIVDRDSMPLPNEPDVDVSTDISATLLFASTISSSLCSLAQSLAFLKAPAPSRNRREEPVKTQLPSWVMCYSGSPPGVIPRLGCRFMLSSRADRQMLLVSPASLCPVTSRSSLFSSAVLGNVCSSHPLFRTSLQ